MNTLNSSNTYRKLLAGATLTAACFLMPHSVLATIFTVSTLADNVPGSLRDAIGTAQDGDTIVFAESLFDYGPGTITLTSGELNIGLNNLSIIGPGQRGILGMGVWGPQYLTINGEKRSPVFNITGSGVFLQNITITGGLTNGPDGGMNNSDTFGEVAQGGGIINFGNLQLQWCIISNNSAQGGQFINSNNGGNGGDGEGGGIANFGTLSLYECTICSNTAIGGQSFGGGFNDLFQPNTSYGGNGWGGGIYNEGDLSLTNCTLSGNSANGADENIVPIGNIGGDGDGGGICIAIGFLSLFNCTIANNSASGGDADFLNDSPFGTSGQSGNGNGGGVCNLLSYVFMQSCTISSNAASGGNMNDFEGASSMAGNGNGGGIYCSFLEDYPQTTLENTIIAGNLLVPGSGGSGAANGSATGPDVFGFVASDGYNFIGQVDGSSGWNPNTGENNDLGGTTYQPANPNLGPLQDNGGPTFTMALLETPGIPNREVDQGNSFGIHTDQRGDLRPVPYNPMVPAPGDYSDIGAYELQVNSPDMTASTGSTSSPDSPGNYYMSTIVSWSNSSGGSFGGTPGSRFVLLTNRPAFGLQKLPVNTPFSPGNWTPFTGAIRYYNGNNQFVASDPIVAGPGELYRLIFPATNVLFILPAATTPATSVSSSSATLNGNTTPYGFNTHYWFEYGTNAKYGLTTATNSLTTVTNPADLATLSQSIGGLTGATLYHYQLVVTDDEGTQFGGDQTFEFGPPTVTTLAASSVTTNAAVANGSVNPNGSSTAVYFEYGLDTNYGTVTVSNNIGTSAQSDLNATITSLSPGTVYHYRVDAFNGNGISFGADVTFTTIAPPRVTTLAAQSIRTNSAVLSGSVNPTGDEATWAFQWGLTTNYGQKTPPLLMSPFTNTMVPVNFPVSGLSPGTLYHYQIVATNSIGSASGGDVTFTTQDTNSTPYYYVGNNLIVTNGAPDGGAPLVILGEYSPTGPLAAASPTTTLPAGVVKYVLFYGQNYNFTLYSLSYVTNGPNTSEPTFQVVASQSFSGTNSGPAIQALAVTNFSVYAGNLLAFAGQGPYYPQNPNDAVNSDATYENSSNPNSGTATPPGGPGTVFSLGIYSDTNANYGYISDVFGNQGRTYGFGVDVLLVP
jgi:hypothetical protein